MRSALWAALIVASLTACGKSEQVSADPTPKKPQVSRLDWLKAMDGVYTKSEIVEGKDGDTKFTACFESGKDGKCLNEYSGNRDPFRKITHLTDKATRSAGKVLDSVIINPYFALSDCSGPTFFLGVEYTGSSWLFVEKVAILVDGEVLLEKSFDHSAVSRDTGGSLVFENAHWYVPSGELTKLRSITSNSKVLVRVTGSKGHDSLNDGRLAALVQRLPSILKAFDALAVRVSAIPECTKEAT